MGTGLHMTYHLLLCPFAQNANRKQKGGENPEDSELKYIFWDFFWSQFNCKFFLLEEAAENFYATVQPSLNW